MKPVDQSKTLDAGQRGNCLAASLASIFEIELTQVPEFEELPPGQWKTHLADWVASKGQMIVKRPPGDYNPDQYYIAVGLSKRGVRHATVALDGAVVHCPHPSRAGIESVEYIFTFEPALAG